MLLSAGLALVAVVAVSAAGRPLPMASLPLAPWWLFAGLFAVTEACVVQLPLRRESFSLSLSEAPLVIGLFLAQPGDLLLGRALGSALVFVAYRRQRPIKAAFNTTLVMAGTGVAVTALRVVLPAGASAFGTQAVCAALAATVAAGVLDSLALSLVVSWYAAPMRLPALLGEIASSVVVSTIVGAAGLVAVAALQKGQATVPLAVAGGLVVLAYRGFATLTDRHTSLERLYDLSDSLAATPAWDDVLASVLTRASDLLRAGYVEVLLAGHGPGRAPSGPQRWFLRAAADEARVEGPSDAADLAGLGVEFPPTRPRLLRPDTPEAREFLAARGLREALVVSLRVDDRAVGHLVVGDRTGEARFAAGDVRLLETVANHGSVALRNGRLIERLHFEARRDELTGLPNRLHFREILAEAAAAAERGAPCAVMVLDFDGFKAINDTLGHQAGDDLLRVLAGRLAGLAADDAVVARLGGDEFAVLVPGCATAASASTVAGRLLGAFDDPVPVGDAQLRLSGSLGIALAPQHGSTGSELLRAADIAMYAAKAGAGGQRMYTPDRGARSADALGLAADLRDAVGAGQIDIALHPVTDLRTGTLQSVEVRACWRHPRLGEVEPALLLEAAERSGQVTALSALVLDRALLLARRWLDEGRPVPLTVDLAPRLLADAGLPRQVAAALHRHGVPPDLLRLEIQEAGVLSDPRRRLDALERLRATGVRLGLGGFGTGYSSLTYLSRLPVDQLSLDGSFVRRLAGHARDQAVARTVVDLGRSLGLTVVGTGVEDEAARAALLAVGCALGQGRLLAGPLTPDAFAAFARDRAEPVGVRATAPAPRRPQ